MARLRGIAGLVALLVSAIAAISLAVAGLGIMNTMLAATRERRREIGIMMAIGARRRDISRCFVVESAIVAGIGGVLGATLGVLGSYAITSALGMPGIFSPLKFLLVECCAVLCGVALAAACFLKILLVDRLLMGNEDVSTMVALVVCITMALTVLVAKVIGCSLPMLAKKIGFDPAVMASPFITTIVDALSLLIYFGTALLLIPGIAS